MLQSTERSAREGATQTRAWWKRWTAGAALLSGAMLSTPPSLALTQSPAQPAPAPAAASDQLEEVVVTAERRQSTVQQVSGSITAVTGEELRNRGFTDFASFAATVPALSSGTSGPGQTEFNLRGVSSPGGNSATVGFYLDDTPLTAAANSNSGKVVVDPNLYDLNRVEVLRGPQGTLYGSSSMGGTIRVITNQPNADYFDANAQTSLSSTDGGGFNHAENAMVNLPIVDGRLALRLVATEDTMDGWVHRVVIAPGAFPDLVGNVRGDVAAAPVARDDEHSNRTEMQTARAILRYQPTADLTITPSILYQHVSQDGPSAFDTHPGTSAHYEAYDIAEPYEERFLLGTLNVEYHLGGVDITSNTAEFSRAQRLTQDNTEQLEFVFGQSDPYLAGPVTFRAADDTQQFSQEFRITSSGDTRFKWLAGVFYSDLRSHGANHSNVPGLIPIVGTANLFSRTQPYEITQSALFGEASYMLTPEWKFTLGVRGFHYETDIVTNVSGVASVTGSDATDVQHVSAKDSGANPRFDVTYTPSADWTLYATASKGFRPGGGSQAVPTNTATTTGAQCAADLAALGLTASPTEFGPDSLWSYELGAKTRLLDRRLTVHGDIYQIDWSGIQQGVNLSCGFGFTTNAGEARIRGAELEINALIGEGLRFDAGVGYIDGKLTSGNAAVGTVAGQPLQTVPAWTANVGLTYTRPISGELEFNGHVEYNYTGKRFNGGFLALTPTPAYELLNARIGVSNSHWAANLFVNNLLNEHAPISYITEQALSLPFYDRAVSIQPLTVGIELRAQY